MPILLADTCVIATHVALLVALLTTVRTTVTRQQIIMIGVCFIAAISTWIVYS